MRFLILACLILSCACEKASSQTAEAARPTASAVVTVQDSDPQPLQALVEWQIDTVRRRWCEFLNLPNNATFEQIVQSDPEPIRQCLSELYGLPPATTWEELHEFEYESSLQEHRTALGLPETASAEEVYCAAEEHRLSLLRKELGLPPTADLQEIVRTRHQRQTVLEAVALGLPPQATAEEVAQAKAERWREAEARRLGLPPSATFAEVCRARADDPVLRELAENGLKRAREAIARVNAEQPPAAAPSPEELRRLQEQVREAQRIKRAAALGLPETATWEEINREAYRRAGGR